ncbi:MAG TPA: type 1 glutamine amidotransferase [Casimicrobiaceae bacterium]|nr:type 1 glutamine amidotransferase [Casimicrobiaceae bacterium]
MLKVGISASFMHGDQPRTLFQGKTLQYIEQNVAHWLMQRDVLALMVPSPDGETRRPGSGVTVDDYARELDALVLMGGSDVCPDTYGEKALDPAWNGDRIRDVYEIALLRAFVALGKPVLGLCRGAQVINVAMGGTLYQDIPTQCPDALRHRMQSIYDRNCHATSIVAGSGLAALYPGATLVKTNSVHHQGVKDLGRELAVEAWSEPDRMVEAIRWTGTSYLVGVQWHPEFHPPGDTSFIDDTPLLDDFLAAATRHKSAAYAL